MSKAYSINNKPVSEADYHRVREAVQKTAPEKMALLNDGHFSKSEVMEVFNQYDPFDERRITDADFLVRGFKWNQLGTFREVKKILHEAGLPTDYDDRCDLKETKKPTDYPVSACEIDEAIEKWPDLDKVKLIKHPTIIDLVKKTIKHLEANNIDQVDVFGELPKKCFSYHMHLVIDSEDSLNYLRGYDSKKKDAEQKLAFALSMIDQKKGLFLHHFDEHANRYPVNSKHRNAVQSYDGKFHHMTAPICDGSLSADHVGKDSFAQFDFAIIPEDHPKFNEAIPLNDGTSRRFLVWFEDRSRR